MYSDFKELYDKGVPPEQIIATLSQKYGYDVGQAVMSGKDNRQILADLILAKPKGGIAEAVTTGLHRGLLEDIPKTIGGALQAPGIFSDFFTGQKEGIPYLTQIGKDIENVGIKAGKYYEATSPEFTGAPAIVYEAFKSLSPSLLVSAGAGSAGAGLARLLGVKDRAKLLAIGEAISPIPFGLSEFTKAMKEHEDTKDQTIPFLGAVIRGVIEYGGEYLGNKYLAKLFGLDEQALPKGIKEWSKQLWKTIQVETGTEFGQEASEQFVSDLVNKYVGKEKFKDKSLLEIIGDSFSAGIGVMPSTALMTIITAGIGRVYGRKTPLVKEKPEFTFTPTETVVPPEEPPPPTRPSTGIPIYSFDEMSDTLIDVFGGGRQPPPPPSGGGGGLSFGIPTTAQDMSLLTSIFGGSPVDLTIQEKAGVPATISRTPYTDIDFAKNLLSVVGGSYEKLSNQLDEILAGRPALKRGIAIPVVPTDVTPPTTTLDATEASLVGSFGGELPGRGRGRIPAKAKEIVTSFYNSLIANRAKLGSGVEALEQTISDMNTAFPKDDWLSTVKDFTRYLDNLIKEEKTTPRQPTEKKPKGILPETTELFGDIITPDTPVAVVNALNTITKLGVKAKDVNTFQERLTKYIETLTKNSQEVANQVKQIVESNFTTPENVFSLDEFYKDIKSASEGGVALSTIKRSPLFTTIQGLADIAQSMKLPEFKNEFAKLTPEVKQSVFTTLKAPSVDAVYKELQRVPIPKTEVPATPPPSDETRSEKTLNEKIIERLPGEKNENVVKGLSDIIDIVKGVVEEYKGNIDNFDAIVGFDTKMTDYISEKEDVNNALKEYFETNFKDATYFRSSSFFKDLANLITEQTKEAPPKEKPVPQDKVSKLLNDFVDASLSINDINDQLTGLPQKMTQEQVKEYEKLRKDHATLIDKLTKIRDDYKKLTGKDIEVEVTPILEQEINKRKETGELLQEYNGLVGSYNRAVDKLPELEKLTDEKSIEVVKQLYDTLDKVYDRIEEIRERYKELTNEELIGVKKVKRKVDESKKTPPNTQESTDEATVLLDRYNKLATQYNEMLRKVEKLFQSTNAKVKEKLPEIVDQLRSVYDEITNIIDAYNELTGENLKEVTSIDDIVEKYGKKKEKLRTDIVVVNKELIPTPPDIIGNKYPILDEHQKLGVNLAVSNFLKGNKGFLFADGTGLGKTMEILATVREIVDRTNKPALIITTSKQVIEGNFKKDARKLRINLNNIKIVTYVDIRAKRNAKGEYIYSDLVEGSDYSVVAFDEAQSLKNVGSNQTRSADRIKAKYKIFATATPMDKIESATYFMSAIADIPGDKLSKSLGFSLIFDYTKNTDLPTVRVKLLSNFPGWDVVISRLKDYRDDAIREGKMIRREYPFLGKITEIPVKMTATMLKEQEEILDFWDSKIASAENQYLIRNLAGQKTLELGRWIETQKLEAVLNELEKDLNAGKSVIIMAERIRTTKIKGLNDSKLDGLISVLASKLTERGIKFATIYGDIEKASQIDQFQKNKVRVAIATPESGGTGINLDDTTGNHPRVMYLVTLGFAGDSFHQNIGRVSRKTTKSEAEVKIFYADKSWSDKRRRQILEHKLSILRAIQAGEDVDDAMGTEVRELGSGVSKIVRSVNIAKYGLTKEEDDSTSSNEEDNINNSPNIQFSLKDDLDKILSNLKAEVEETFGKDTADRISNEEVIELKEYSIDGLLKNRANAINTFAGKYGIKLNPVDTTNKDTLIASVNNNAKLILEYIKNNTDFQNFGVDDALEAIRIISYLTPIDATTQGACILNSNERTTARGILSAIRKSPVANSYYYIPFLGNNHISYFVDLMDRVLSSLDIEAEKKMAGNPIVDKARVWRATELTSIPYSELDPLFNAIDRAEKLTDLYGKRIDALISVSPDGTILYKGRELVSSSNANHLLNVSNFTYNNRNRFKYKTTEPTIFSAISEKAGLNVSKTNTIITLNYIGEQSALINTLGNIGKVRRKVVDLAEDENIFIKHFHNWLTTMYSKERSEVVNELGKISEILTTSTDKLKELFSKFSSKSSAPYIRLQNRMTTSMALIENSYKIRKNLKQRIEGIIEKHSPPESIAKRLRGILDDWTEGFISIEQEQARVMAEISQIFSDLPSTLSNALSKDIELTELLVGSDKLPYTALWNKSSNYVMIQKNNSSSILMVNLGILPKEERVKIRDTVIAEATGTFNDASITEILNIIKKYRENRMVISDNYDNGLMSFGVPVNYFKPFFTKTAYKDMQFVDFTFTASNGKKDSVKLCIPNTVVLPTDPELGGILGTNLVNQIEYNDDRTPFNSKLIQYQLNTSAIFKDLGLPNPFVASINSRIDRILSTFVNRILSGMDVRVEIVNSNSFINAIRDAKVSDKALISALLNHGVTLKEIKERGLENIVKDRFAGATISSESLLPVIFINDNLSTFDKIKTGLHEIVEAFITSGLISDRDVRIAQREFTDGIRDWKENFADSLASYIMEEEAISDRHRGLLGRVYDFIKDFINKLRNLLAGDGFRSSRDIFREVYGGKYTQPNTVVPVGDAIAFDLKYDSWIKTVYRAGKDIGFNDLLDSATTALSKTMKNPKMKSWMKYLLPPQWMKTPTVSQTLARLRESKDYVDSIIYDTLSDYSPLLDDLKKKNKDEYSRFNQAIIDSDILGVDLTNPDIQRENGDLLKTRYKLSDDSITLYKRTKELFDSMIDKIFDEYRRVLLVYSLDKVKNGFVKSAVFNTLLNRDNAITFASRFRKDMYTTKDALTFFGIPDIKSEEVYKEVTTELQNIISEIQPEIQELEENLLKYKEGFYFPRIRPAGNHLVSLLKYTVDEKGKPKLIPMELYTTDKSVSEAKERFQAELILKDILKRFKHPVHLKDVVNKTNADIAQMIKGHDVIVVYDSNIASGVAGLAKDTPVILMEELIRMPKSYYEGVSDRMIREHLMDLIHKVGEKADLTGESRELFKKFTAFLKDEIQTDLKARQLATARFIRRKGRGEGNIDLELLDDPRMKVTSGYFTDISDVVKKYVIAESEHVGRLRATSSLFLLRNDEAIAKELNSDPQLFDWYKSYTRAVLSSPSYAMQLAQKAKALVALWYIGGKVSTGFIQLTQMINTGVPELATFIDASPLALENYEGRARPLSEVSAHVARQADAMKRIISSARDVFTNNLKDDEKEALHVAISKGITMSKFTNDLMSGFHEVTGRYIAPIAKYAMFFFQYAEEKSREAGFIASYRLARQKGLDFNSAVDFASAYTTEAFHIYGTINRPLVALGDGGFNALANTALSLKGFTVNYLGWCYNALKEQNGKRFADKVLFSVAYTMFFGGLFVIPGVGDLLDLLSALLGIPLKKKIVNSITTNKAVQEGLEFGVLAPTFKIDLSGSMRVELLPRELSTTGISDYLFGVWSGAGTKLTRAKYALQTGQYMEALKSISPTALEQTLKAGELLAGKPLKTIYGKEVVDQFGKPVNPSTFEKALMLFGFRPVTLAETTSIYLATKTVNEYFNRKKDKIYTMLKTANSAEELANVVKSVNDYNEQALKYRGAIPFILPDNIATVLKNSKGKISKLAPVLFD